MLTANPFRVAMTADFYGDLGAPRYKELGLSIFNGVDHVAAKPLKEHLPEISPAQLAGFQAVVVLTPRVTAATVSQSDNLLIISRFGVGYDSVDVQACTNADVLATITAGSVDRPVAEATVAWILSLTHNVLIKDRLVRGKRWDDRSHHMGCELRDRTLGVVGLGGIGRTVIHLLRGFGMKPPIAFDPFADDQVFETVGARKTCLDELLGTADFVSIHCPLTDDTRGLIGRRELALMKPHAYLINTARGNIVDENELHEALSKNRIAGAAMDCFATEPVVVDHPLSDLDNVMLAPHCIAWTNEMFRDTGRTACQSILDTSLGKRAHGVLNPELYKRASFRKKWAHITGLDVE